LPPLAQIEQIFADLERFQSSVYNFEVVGFIRDYLLSVNFAEELVRMMEDENYKLVSLPPSRLLAVSS
jgi:hypothetical protein